LTVVAGEIKGFIASEAGNGRLKDARGLLATALSNVEGMLGTFLGWLGESQTGKPAQLYLVGLHSRRLLLAMGDVVVGWLLLRQAEVALHALTAGEVSTADKSFYEGKIAAARFFAHEVLPRLAGDHAVVTAANLDPMELDEQAF
jgi:hypothetical protein